MFSVLHVLSRSPARLGHAARSSSATAAALASRLTVPGSLHSGNRHARAVSEHIVLPPAEPPPQSDLREFIAVLSASHALSPAAVSRTAARVIRSCLRNNNMDEAVIILSALRAANDKRESSGEERRFPLRLASTTLVHGLLHQKNIHQAARLAREVMPAQEHLFKTKTIDAVVQALCPKLFPGQVGRSESDRIMRRKRLAWVSEGFVPKPLPPPESPDSLTPIWAPRRVRDPSKAANPFSVPWNGQAQEPPSVFSPVFGEAPSAKSNAFPAPPISPSFQDSATSANQAPNASNPFSVPCNSPPIQDPLTSSPPGPASGDSANPSNPFSAPWATQRDDQQTDDAPAQKSERDHLGKLYRLEREQWSQLSRPPPGRGLDASTRMAIALLAQARRTKQRRTNDMYKRVVDACLFQGEIATAALLFAILLYDIRRHKHGYQQEQAPEEFGAIMDAPGAKEAMRSLFINPEEIRIVEQQTKALYERLRGQLGECAELPEGDHSSDTFRMMNNITWELNGYEHRTSPQGDQARGTLATAWMLCGMPFSCISLVVKSLYAIAKTKTPWPPEKKAMGEQMAQVRTAYRFCHATLSREILRIKLLGEGPSGLHWYDTRSYNALLHYALRHRLSSPMASCILQQMKQQAWFSAQPDQATYGILLRSATLLRQNDAAAEVLQRFATAKDQQMLSVIAGIDKVHPRKPKRQGFASRIAWSHAIAQQPKNDLPIPESDLGQVGGANEHVINSMLTHYTATGRPDLVVQLVPHILPSISLGETTSEVAIRGLHRAVLVGPSTIATLLNACVKTKRTGLAERVWRLALRAERASWTNGPWGEARHGWFLGIEVYTLMMQLYAEEGKYRLGQVNRLRLAYATKMGLHKGFAVGWGFKPVTKERRTALHQQAVELAQLRTRWIAARRQGLRLFRLARYGGRRALRRLAPRRLIPAIPEKISWDPQALERFRRRPLPDARFFNACLDLFGRKIGMAQRTRHNWRKRHIWISRYRRILKLERRFGIVWKNRDPDLPDILAWMRQLRFPIPLAFAHVVPRSDYPRRFVHWELTEADIRNRQKVAPFDYPQYREKFHAYKIPVPKERGLPIRRGSRYTPYRWFDHARAVGEQLAATFVAPSTVVEQGAAGGKSKKVTAEDLAATLKAPIATMMVNWARTKAAKRPRIRSTKQWEKLLLKYNKKVSAQSAASEPHLESQREEVQPAVSPSLMQPRVMVISSQGEKRLKILGSEQERTSSNALPFLYPL